MTVIKHCYIDKSGIKINNIPLIENHNVEVDYLKYYYDFLKIDYPKYHKMDGLSKHAIIADFIINPFKISEYSDDELSLIMANSCSSQQIDKKFIESYQVYNSPSPSLFVYTLPNILIGELSIKNKWHGEHCFFICENFDSNFFLEQVTITFAKGHKFCFLGWVNVHGNLNDESLWILIENNGPLPSSTNLNNIIKKYRNERFKTQNQTATN